ncbi:hypothetical protein GF357_01185 [Candidatus Dojkabacteria bacterium]|nr:hypothetical protein [Candidatus Dojkabacteria bacterium]
MKTDLRRFSQKMGKSTITYLMIILLVTKFLGFIKLRIWASLFGASGELDIFWAAFTIPDMMFNVLISGSINAAIIPVFSEILYKNKDSAKGERKLAKVFFDLNLAVSILFIAFGIIIFLTARQFSQVLIGGSFIRDALNITQEFTVYDVTLMTRLTRIMVLSPIFLGFSTIITGYLRVHKRFFITNISAMVYNLVIIAAAIIIVEKMGLGIEGLSVAVVMGSLLQLLVQLPAFFEVLNGHLKGSGVFEFAGKKMFKIFRLSLPRLISALAEQFNLVVNRIISFTITRGTLSAYQFALSLSFFPVHIITGGMSQVALTKLAELHSKGKTAEFKKVFNSNLQMMFFLVMPFVSYLLVLRLPIVRLAYGTGEFDWWSTIFTSWSLALISFSMIGQLAVSITLRALYAIHETRLPLIATFLTIIVNILATYYFTNFFSHYADWRPIVGEVTHQLSVGDFWRVMSEFFQDLGTWFTTRYKYDYAVGGIAVGFSIAYLFEMTVNFIILNFKVEGIISWKKTIKPFLTKSFNGLAMSVIMYLVYRWADRVFDTTKTISVFAVFVISSSAGGLVYLLLSYLFKVRELGHVFDRISVFLESYNINVKSIFRFSQSHSGAAKK